MSKVKRPNVAGLFYEADSKKLKESMNTFSDLFKREYPVLSRLIIVPHAGYVYSGHLAYSGFQYLDKSVKNIFVIAPSHYKSADKCVISSAASWLTPFGQIFVNQEINHILISDFDCIFNDEAFEKEHSIEVQLPFLQNQLIDARIIPILCSEVLPEKILKIIKYFYSNPENAFVISTDLSHFYSLDDATKIDNYTASLLETGEYATIVSQQACGCVILNAIVDFVATNNYSLIRVGLTNSSSVTKNKENVVGYGAWFLVEMSKNKFLKKYFSTQIIDIAKKSIAYFLKENTLLSKDDIGEYSPIFDENGTCFVTLENKGLLRGCVGSLISSDALIKNLIVNSYSAAFSDSRFCPLLEEEFEELSVKVSLLGLPESISFVDEDDLFEKIEMFKDGIILQDGDYQAVYLPSVWQQIPDKKMFIASLKRKAGLQENYFSSTLNFYKFQTEYIE